MDMREIGFSDQFDAIINVSTSFGYFLNESDNTRSLHSTANALGNDGRFLLDLENVYYLAHMSSLYGTAPTYQPVNRFRGWLEETTFFDPVSHIVKMRLRLWRKGRVVKDMRARYRVYSLPEIRSMLESCGFHIYSIYGDFGLQPYNVDSPRMIILCEKSQ